jgi:hypothetical protein
MKTLHAISKMNPSTYRVIDSAHQRGDMLTWSDRIEITIGGKHHRDCKRRAGYKYGLCVGAK